MNAFVHVAGWTLVHFAWQGALIALVAAIALQVLRTASPQTRYLVACASLAAMLAAPVVTARMLSATPSVGIQVARRSATAVAAPNQTQTWLDGVTPDNDQRMPPHHAREGIDAFLPLAVATWVAGVALLLVRLAGGWWRVQRQRRASFRQAPSRWQSAGRRIAERLHLRRSVLFVDSPAVDTPTVIGWLRPVILLPIAALTNLTPGQVEAVLAHELAHIRRHDYIVNLLQSVAETLLFYHPAVWWISSRIRAEREHCCDEVAVAVCGDAVGYAAALTELETWRTASASLALAATGGSLLERVRRVLHVRADDEWPSSNALATAAVILLLVVVAGGSRYLPTLQASTSAPRTLDRIPSPDSRVPARAQVRTNWQTYATPHFDVLYTQAIGVDLQDIERDAEAAYQRIWSDLAHDLSFRPTLVLFASQQELDRGFRTRDFPQTSEHILLSLDAGRPLSGDLAHEITHSFFFDILPRSVSTSLPLWISEGLAEYQRGDWNATDRATLTGLVRTSAIPRLSRLTRGAFSETPSVNNRLGHAAFDFIVDGWGRDGLRRLLLALRQSDATGSLDNVLRAAFGLSADEFDRGFEAYLKERFAAAPAGTQNTPRLRVETAPTGGEIMRLQRGMEELRIKAREAAQAVTAASPTFEVASVKPNKAADQATIVQNFPDRFSATNISLRLLIRFAFQLQDSQISGGPSWLNSDRFDVAAKAESNSSQYQNEAMMRALLVDRFKLRTHNETRDVPVYAVIMARSDRKLGAQLRLTDCGRGTTSPSGPPNGDQPQPCGSVRAGLGRVTVRGMPMAQVMTVLSPLLNRVAVDRTDLNGNFDFDLEWTPDQAPQGAARDPNGSPVPPRDPNGPSIFTAMQEQLGLKLEAQRAPIEVVVIDSVEKPTEN